MGAPPLFGQIKRITPQFVYFSTLPYKRTIANAREIAPQAISSGK